MGRSDITANIEDFEIANKLIDIMALIAKKYVILILKSFPVDCPKPSADPVIL